MGKIRKHAPHIRWTDKEIEILKSHYSSMAYNELENLLSGRHRRIIQCKANDLGLFRLKKPKRTREEYLKAKRESMARRRSADIDGARKYHRDYHNKNREKVRDKNRIYARKRFFWNREMHLRGKDRATTKEISLLWKKQKGKCALTGRRLDRTAQLDHILPKARGGTDRIDNLRWTCELVNISKRHMTDEEFFILCEDVMHWLGERIDKIDKMIK